MKKILALILAALMLFSVCALAESNTGATEGIQSDAEFYAKADLSVLNGKKIGVTIQDLKNPYWAGVMQLTKSLAVEWAKRNVRVNSISPGYIGTELIMAAPQLKPLIEQWNAMAPMGRLGKPEELGSICVYLAGDTSSFTTGSDFVIDGAFTCF